jgi:CheY-like chemotaxis protein
VQPAILVVDDEPLIREVATSVLERAGFRVVCAADGLEACAILQRVPGAIAAVVLDDVMPNLRGAETLLRLRELRPGLPAVFSSGRAVSERAVAALPGPPALYLHKPYRGTALVDTVRRALEG